MTTREAVLASLDREVVLRDGARVRLRPIRAEDEAGLVDLYGRLSRHTAYQRFFSVMRRLPPDWAHFLANVDSRRRYALVAERPDADGPALVAVARYEPSEDPDVAEVAFVVQDLWQNRGLGTLLLRDLLRAAAANGIVYAIGGQTPNVVTYQPVVEAYDPTTDSWSTKAPMPTPRFGHGVAAANGVIFTTRLRASPKRWTREITGECCSLC